MRLTNTGSGARARVRYRAGDEASLAGLRPRSDGDFECLIDIDRSASARAQGCVEGIGPLTHLLHFSERGNTGSLFSERASPCAEKIGRRYLLFLLGAFLEPYHALNLSVEHEGQDRATLWQALFDVELRRDACRGNDESTRD